MSYELFPDYKDVPPETWEGADPEFVVDQLIKRTGTPEDDLPPGIGLLELVRLAKPIQITEKEIKRASLSDPSFREDYKAYLAGHRHSAGI